MSELIAPRLIGEKDFINKYGKRVVSRHFTLPDETITEYLVWGGTVTPVVIFPVVNTTDDGFAVVAVRQFRYGANEFVIELPGGCPEPGQKPEDVAIEELLEETGYVAEEYIRLGGLPLWPDAASCITDIVPMLALGCKKVAEPQPDEEEVMETLVIPFKEWEQMIRDGRIRDMKAIAITLLALLYFSLP